MSTTIIEKRLCLDCKYLNADIKKNILEKLREITQNDCTKNYGYILNIINIIEIKEHKIGRANCSNVFMIKFEAETLKPEVGKKLNGKIIMIYKDGIFLIIKDKQKMLIPKNLLNDYEFDDETGTYKNKNTNKIVKIDDDINVIVTASEYNKKDYSCFGSIA
jgi:DNA-directed RNA polymerase subunit E'/Rpb7